MENYRNQLSVYNTLTGEYEGVPVTEEVYHAYRRTGWNMMKNDAKHSVAIPFSNLIGGDDGAFENFGEFVSDNGNPPHTVEDRMSKAVLHRILSALPEAEKRLIAALVVDGKSEREYARKRGSRRKR